MRNPEYVLNSLAAKSGDQNYKFQRIYRNLYNRQFYCLAYRKLAKKRSVKKQNQETFFRSIHQLIADLKAERYQPEAIADSRQGRFHDSLVQEIVRMLLEAIYEGVFSNDSHGFRPRRSCHTALLQVKRDFINVNWMIHADLHPFFSSIDLQLLRVILRKRIMDEKFIRLINKFLRTGALNDWQFQQTYSGTPIGGIIGPILANIYFHELDMYVKKLADPPYKGNLLPENRVEKMAKPAGRRLVYVRYGGEMLLGVNGSKREAGIIRDQVAQFVQCQLKIPHPQEHFTVRHAGKPTRFLGYDILVKKRCKLYLPHDIWVSRLHGLKAVKTGQNGLLKPVHRSDLVKLGDPEILSVCNAVIQSMYNYYRLADNASVMSRFHHFIKYSMVKTLAFKYKKSVRKIMQKYLHEGKFAVVTETDDGSELIKLYDGGFAHNSSPILQDDVDRIPERKQDKFFERSPGMSRISEQAESRIR
ncbi:reverse transcriptase/maturase family protein [Thermoactinomyces mirandus]|uniref:Group II intron reverse transcriptase/maturase n=1 Tax=Thermoactinomyces mirandus TaxID=2756294 RepID=A0A7W1XSG5_9BACL|nr:reverse transcriptase/maturase family protein [Thermoactinomyces mirandus]MBA4602355.1 group II intron reverse transcriptase/maturase [Thermoactinomyces mirandus]